MPASSKMDPLLAKAEPISHGGSASGITELRRKKTKQNKTQQFLQPERGVRRCERNNFAGTKVSAEGGAGGAPGTGAEIPLQPLEKTMVRQAVPCSPWRKDEGVQRFHLQPVEDPMPEQVEAPEGGCDPWEAHAGASSWQDLWPHGKRSPGQSRFAGRTCDPVGDPCWSSLFLKVCTLWEGPTLEQLVKNCSPWEGLILEKLVEDCLPWEGPHAGAGAECEESSP
ncbi:hypothetical protein GRJ2_003031100 [Grus japonensis]|uniref:Uncharacterized protein n=1 Tax=Grus japonensis TaxID=30415 RepID=A0ABC9Y6I1_GRUJA